MTTPRGPADATDRPNRVEAVFPLALVALGVFTLVDATTIAVPRSASILGPRGFPYAVGVLLVLAGTAVLIGIVRGGGGDTEAAEDVDLDRDTDWRAVGLLAGSFLALVVLLEPVGWPIAATVLFAGTAWSLGARPWWRPLVAGAIVALVTHVVFTRALNVYLPSGPLQGVPFLG